MTKCVVVGGSRGIGSAIVKLLLDRYDTIEIIDILDPLFLNEKISYTKFDLSKNSIILLQDIIANTDALVITAGIGRVNFFENLSIPEIEKTLSINIISTIELLHIFYPALLNKEKDTYCMVIGSMAGNISSPLFSVYGASKASINKICESLNIELEKSGSKNRITNIMPLSFPGSSFSGKETDLASLQSLASECIDYMFQKKDVYYPNPSISNRVFRDYMTNCKDFGLSSFDYKIKNRRLDNRKIISIGYLSGTFDLFHVGHLNLLKRAKDMCDYLIVGIHKDASHKGKDVFIPFEERKAIIESIKYVDKVVESQREDSDAWYIYKYDYLFVGSDYKGTDRFNRYEEILGKEGVKIVYFPYTTGTSSTQLRAIIDKKGKK